LTRRWKTRPSDRPSARLTARPTACALSEEDTWCLWQRRAKHSWEGEAPAEPHSVRPPRLSGSCALPPIITHSTNCSSRTPLQAGRGRARGSRFGRWWQERFDLAPLIEFASKKTVPVHRLSWIYLLGGIALFLFAAQIASGCLLMLYYQPGEGTSYESVQRIMTEVPYGWFVRSAHAWGLGANVC
jgi:hypothetical protein